ncbi:MAG TPA: hypothetical protein VI111_01150, partial [Thermoleophilaceae bacterium]
MTDFYSIRLRVSQPACQLDGAAARPRGARDLPISSHRGDAGAAAGRNDAPMRRNMWRPWLTMAPLVAGVVCVAVAAAPSQAAAKVNYGPIS